MASIWRRSPTAKGMQTPQLMAPQSNPFAAVNVHSHVAGNGQHYVFPPRTGGQPHIGHKGSAPQLHPFAPAETHSPFTGGVNMPTPTRLRATTPAAITSATGQTAGTFQLAPGGGINMPAAQRGPGRIGR